MAQPDDRGVLLGAALRHGHERARPHPAQPFEVELLDLPAPRLGELPHALPVEARCQLVRRHQREVAAEQVALRYGPKAFQFGLQHAP